MGLGSSFRMGPEELAVQRTYNLNKSHFESLWKVFYKHRDRLHEKPQRKKKVVRTKRGASKSRVKAVLLKHGFKGYMRRFLLDQWLLKHLNERKDSPMMASPGDLPEPNMAEDDAMADMVEDEAERRDPVLMSSHEFYKATSLKRGHLIDHLIECSKVKYRHHLRFCEFVRLVLFIAFLDDDSMQQVLHYALDSQRGMTELKDHRKWLGNKCEGPEGNEVPIPDLLAQSIEGAIEIDAIPRGFRGLAQGANEAANGRKKEVRFNDEVSHSSRSRSSRRGDGTGSRRGSTSRSALSGEDEKLTDEKHSETPLAKYPSPVRRGTTTAFSFEAPLEDRMGFMPGSLHDLGVHVPSMIETLYKMDGADAASLGGITFMDAVAEIYFACDIRSKYLTGVEREAPGSKEFTRMLKALKKLNKPGCSFMELFPYDVRYLSRYDMKALFKACPKLDNTLKIARSSVRQKLLRPKVWGDLDDFVGRLMRQRSALSRSSGVHATGMTPKGRTPGGSRGSSGITVIRTQWGDFGVTARVEVHPDRAFPLANPYPGNDQERHIYWACEKEEDRYTPKRCFTCDHCGGKFAVLEKVLWYTYDPFSQKYSENILYQRRLRERALTRVATSKNLLERGSKADLRTLGNMLPAETIPNRLGLDADLYSDDEDSSDTAQWKRDMLRKRGKMRRLKLPPRDTFRGKWVAEEERLNEMMKQRVRRSQEFLQSINGELLGSLEERRELLTNRAIKERAESQKVDMAEGTDGAKAIVETGRVTSEQFHYASMKLEYIRHHGTPVQQSDQSVSTAAEALNFGIVEHKTSRRLTTSLRQSERQLVAATSPKANQLRTPPPSDNLPSPDANEPFPEERKVQLPILSPMFVRSPQEALGTLSSPWETRLSHRSRYAAMRRSMKARESE